MLFRKLWRTMGLYRAQFISMVLMIALGIGVFVGFNMEWIGIRENTNSFFESTGYADYRLINEKGFNKDDLQSVRDIDGVKKAALYLSVNVDVKNRTGDSVSLNCTTNEDVTGMLLMKGEKYDENSKNGIWLSDKYADLNDFSVGDSISLKYGALTIKGKIKGLIKAGEQLVCVRDESQLMPDYKTFGFCYVSPALLKENGVEFWPQIHVISDLSEKQMTKRVNSALSSTVMLLTREESHSYASAKGEMEEGQTMAAVLPVLFLLIAVLTMVTTMHRLAAQEKTQIGTLKALGFHDSRIVRHYTSFATVIGILGALIGIALGYLVGWYFMNPGGPMGTYFDMPEWKLYMPAFCPIVVILVIALLTLIGYLSVKQMLRGTAADALRPYVPKNQKRLLIENTKLWHKFGFGARWNLRDIMRHKSRTAMSLIGIVGSVLIIVCAFGMSDTMQAFMDLYYNGAIHYDSRIYLTEEATDAERTEIIDRYNGDWSASVNVQLEDKSYSLDIYSLENDLVRLPDKKSGYISLHDGGAYLCTRIADEYQLKVGDSFKISPFGQDKTYTLKVAGIGRSVSENITITPAYAKKLGISFRPDSVYTTTAKKDIETSKAIKSIQAKSKIIDSFDTFMEIMQMSVTLLVAAAMLLGLIVLYNLGVMSYTERYREMATLKVVGFRDRKIASLLIGQNLWVTVVGVLLGLPAGAATLDYMLKTMAGEYEMKMRITPLTFILSTVLAVLVSLLVSVMVARKNRKIDMVEALKSAE